MNKTESIYKKIKRDIVHVYCSDIEGMLTWIGSRCMIWHLILAIVVEIVLIALPIYYCKSGVRGAASVHYYHDTFDGSEKWCHNDEEGRAISKQCTELFFKCMQDGRDFWEEVAKLDGVHVFDKTLTTRVGTNGVDHAVHMSVECSKCGVVSSTISYSSDKDTPKVDKCSRCGNKLRVVINWEGDVVTRTNYIMCPICNEELSRYFIVGRPE